MNWNYFSTDKSVIFDDAHKLSNQKTAVDVKDLSIKLTLINDLIEKHTDLAPVSSLPTDQYGKPFLFKDCPFHINFSHSDTVCVSVIAPHPCGIDVQYLKPYHRKVAQKYFTPQQFEICETAPAHMKDHYYIEFWTQFEAICKCDGRGISLAFSDIKHLRNTISTVSFWDNDSKYCISLAYPHMR